MLLIDVFSVELLLVGGQVDVSVKLFIVVVDVIHFLVVLIELLPANLPSLSIGTRVILLVSAFKLLLLRHRNRLDDLSVGYVLINLLVAAGGS